MKAYGIKYRHGSRGGRIGSHCDFCGVCKNQQIIKKSERWRWEDNVNDIFRYLDQHINDDLIDVAHNIRTKFGLTDREVHDIIKMWQQSNDTDGKERRHA